MGEKKLSIDDEPSEKNVAELEPLDPDKNEKSKFEDFDDILEVVGSQGKYQKIILYGVLTPLVIICPLFVMNKIFMLSIPDHWCHVPGRRNDTDINVWKNLTLPTEIGPDGQPRFSQCKMFDEYGSVVKCDSWEYDKTNYEQTMPSNFNWVCDDAHYATDVFSIGGFGNVLGTVIFGQAADRWGRKPVFFLTILIFISFQFISLFVPQYFIFYLVLQFLAGTAFPFLFSAPTMIAAEVSSKDYRAWIYSVAWMVWVIGNSFLPLVTWFLRDWFLIGTITTIPAAFLLLYYKVVQESPRWLLAVGNVDEAEKIIKDIARVNGRPIDPEELHEALHTIAKKDRDKKEKDNNGRIGIWSLFTKRNLARNTIMLCLAWSINSLIYYGLTLNTTNMSGNEFLNYFVLGIIELPAGYLAGVFVGKSGRRWTQAFFFILCSLSFLVASCAVSNKDLSWLVLVAALCAKFGVTITSLVVYLQGTEIFPTQLRSTGSGLASTISSVIGTCGPYIVFLGKFHAAGPYMVLTALAFVGTIASSCLPETLNQNLPETLEDANAFGKNQKFWSFLPEEKNLKSPKTTKTENANNATIIDDLKTKNP